MSEQSSISRSHANSTEPEKWSTETVLRELKDRPAEGTSSPIPFFHLLERLKTTKRAGWKRFDVKAPESISDHMYRMSIMTMLAPAPLRSKLDLGRCTHLALVHDMAEAVVGDITPVDGVSKPEKSRRERSTMDFFCQNLLGNVDDGVAAAEIKDLWEEYEAGETLESVFVHDVDKIELLLQTIEYERQAEGQLDICNFTRVAQAVKLPETREWVSQIFEERAKMWEGFGRTPGGYTIDQIRQLWEKQARGE